MYHGYFYLLQEAKRKCKFLRVEESVYKNGFRLYYFTLYEGGFSVLLLASRWAIVATYECTQ
jgi:hypothetical protein